MIFILGAFHLLGSHVYFAGHHAVYLFERFQESLPGMVFRSNDLGMFFQKSYRVWMDDLSQIHLHIPSSMISRIDFNRPTHSLHG
jgi:hypothetical protein